jgi:hypothetical protein
MDGRCVRLGPLWREMGQSCFQNQDERQRIVKSRWRAQSGEMASTAVSLTTTGDNSGMAEPGYNRERRLDWGEGPVSSPSRDPKLQTQQ